MALGSIIGGIASALGAVGGAITHGDANAEARRQFDDSLAFQRYQYGDMRFRNSLLGQVLQAKEAGLNPSIALGSGLAGNTSSVGGASPTASMSPYDPSSATNNIAQIAQNSELVDSQSAVNFAGAAESLQSSIGRQIDNAYKDKNWELVNRLTKMQGDLTFIQWDTLNKTQGNSLMQSHWQSELVRAAASAQLLSNKWIDERQQAEVNSIIAQAYASYATGQASLEQAAAYVAYTAASTDALKAQFGDTPDARRQFYDETIENFRAMRSMQGSQEFSNYVSPFTNMLGQIGSTAAAAFVPGRAAKGAVKAGSAVGTKVYRSVHTHYHQH